MAIKVVPIDSRYYPGTEKTDCIVLRVFDKDSVHMDIAFPFHEDTPNFQLTIAEAMSLRSAIDELIDIKLLEKPREVITHE